MAGLGAKLFTAFSKLTAAQVNGYLMDQSIMRFASSAVRDAAFGGVGEPTLAEGMTCYLDDTNVLQSYNGSAWVTVINTDRPAGLELIASQTVGSAVSSVTFSNAFNSNYDDYRIIYTNGTASSTCDIRLQLGSANSSYYGFLIYGNYGATTVSGVNTNAGTLFPHCGGGDSNYCIMALDVFSPYLARGTTITTVTNLSGVNFGMFAGRQATSTQFTAFTISPSSGTLTGGTITIYGYRKPN
jgi:hypothetical protein